MDSAERAVPSTEARRGLAIFLALVVLGSGPLLWRIVTDGRPIAELPAPVFALMWVPAVASVLARLANGEGFADLSFRLRDRLTLRLVLLGVLFPVAVGALAYGSAWALGLVSFQRPTAGPLVGSFGVRLLLAGTLGTLVGVITAAGEEIGWRGYMIPRMLEAGVPRPFVVGGLLWGLWHVPAIVSGQYAGGDSPWLSVGLFLVLTVALTALWSTWTMAAGSLWPAIIAHAAWNAVIQGPFDAFSSGPLATELVGESGVLVVAVSVGLVVGLLHDRLEWRGGVAGASSEFE